ncbi:TetR/AcrR family transcriptional regulator [Flagellimonas halotolerans]|uniref:TetR/AcrR family transcriptional regulator n=1 Tax=Flagellimonas halotolerans TaxID=3112164 RepID=A0ABU6ITP5_9FLAO|nr:MULTISPECIES: TetR/AcrR family transcriptional regulator [unclassified Allomuricauda]MEC3966697.1 TetR/AcrR family transcriptional regulator [Muricauda sp. SYSU M86414]MEC4266497.1 TetR/AcrR family transcriptional regulator [Muricauda sp. SYSU M84420]
MQRSDLHQHIITTAGNLFYYQGYNSTGINEIISKCDIAKATLYSHFKSKEDICVAYLKQRHGAFMNSLKDYVNQRTESKNQLLAIFDLLRDMYLEENFQGCWGIKTLGELSPDQTTILGVIQQQKKELLLYLGEVVGGNIANLSKAETEKISSGLYLLYESAVTESHLFKNDWPIFMAKSIAPLLITDMDLK